MLTSLAAGQVALVSGPISRGSNLDAFTNNGTASNPIGIRGVLSTDGDLESNGRTQGGSLVTTNFPVITYTTGALNVPQYSICEFLSVAGATTGGVINASASVAPVFRRCSFANTHASSASAAIMSAVTNDMTFVDCDLAISSSSSSAKAVGGNPTRSVFRNCLFSGSASGAGGVSFGNAAGIHIGNCMFRDLGFGIVTTAFMSIVGNSFRNISGLCIKTTGGSTIITNNVAWGPGGSSQFYSTSGTVRANTQLCNFVGGMGVADADHGNWLDRGVIALSADPFTSSTDLTLNSTPGGGAFVRASGYPAYLDGGAWQHQDAGGGSAGGGCVIGSPIIRGLSL